MKTAPTCPPCRPPLAATFLIAWLGTFFLACTVFAQRPGTGIIVGRVFNPATGEYLRNAEVRAEGTNRTAVTQGDGFYRLTEVPAGEVTVRVSYTGYQTATTTLVLGAGETATRDFDLRSTQARATSGDEPVYLEAFTVSAEREGNAKAIMDQRAAMNIKNVVASDIFGDVAEGNVGEFLKFMPGIDLEYAEADTRSVRIRGLAPKYAAVMFDGNRMANAASSNLGTGRAFEFEQVSINSVDTIEVNKTISANMDADAPAGAINLKSKSAFNRKGRYISWQVNAVANSNELNFKKTPGPGDGYHHKILPGGILEFSDTFLGGWLGVAATISESNMYNDQLRVQNTYDNVPTASSPEPVVPVTIRWKDGPKFTERTAASLNLDYKLNRHTTVSLRSQFNLYDAEFHNRQLMLFAPRVRLAPGSDENTMISVPTTSNSNVTRAVLGGNSQNKYGNTGSVTAALDYKRDDLVVDGSVAFSQSINHYDDLEKGFFYNYDAWLHPMSWRLERSTTSASGWNFTQLTGADMYSLSSYQASAGANRVNSQPRSSRDRQWSGQLNAKWTAPWRLPTFLQAGLKVREEVYNLANYNLSWTYVGPTGDRTQAVVPVSIVWIDPEKGGNLFDRKIEFPDRTALAALFREHPEYFVPNPANATSDTNRFAERYIKEQIGAAYLMGNTRIGRLTLQGGARVEDTRNGSKIYEQGERKYRTGDYTDLFFSGSAKYRFTENLMAIASFSQALLRPDFNNLSGVATINDEQMTGTIPNADLKPEYSNNYSTRLEYYFEPVGVIAAGVFQNDIKDIQYRATDIAAEDIGLGDDYPGFVFTSWRNGEELRIRGMELEYSQQLTFLPGVLSGLSVFANYTRNLSSDLIMAGRLAPKIVSGGVTFRHKRATVSVKCVWNDDTFESYGDSATNQYIRYRKARTMVDLNASFAVHRKLTLFASARNIFDEPSIIYENTRDLLYQHDQFGITITCGVKGTF
ncbi:MAG TPA: TonB-dependent receptor [Opitutaceae bacterium]